MNASLLLLLFLMILVLTVTVVSGDAAPEVDMTEEEIRRTLDGMSLAMLVNILEEQGVYLGDNYYSKEELIDYIIQLARSDKSKATTAESESKSDSRKKASDQSTSTLYNDQSAGISKKSLTILEQFKNQVRSDLAPYLLLVPVPVKRYFAHMLPKLQNTVGQLVRGATVPMLHVAVQALRRAGGLLVAASTRLEDLLKPPAKDTFSWS